MTAWLGDVMMTQLYSCLSLSCCVHILLKLYACSGIKSEVHTNEVLISCYTQILTSYGAGTRLTAMKVCSSSNLGIDSLQTRIPGAEGIATYGWILIGI